MRLLACSLLLALPACTPAGPSTPPTPTIRARQVTDPPTPHRAPPPPRSRQATDPPTPPHPIAPPEPPPPSPEPPPPPPAPEQIAAAPTTDEPETADAPTRRTRDPNYGTCKNARAHNAGPYIRGQDPEYAYYKDRDHDGIVCE